MEIKDNEFSRQFETTVHGKLMAVEYSFQERKIFLTKVNIPEGMEESFNEFLKAVLDVIEERNLRVMPIHPKVAAFFRKNPRYKEMLPPGIRL